MGNNDLSAVLGPLSWMIMFQSIFLGEKVQAISSTPSNWCAETGGSTCHRNHPWSGCCQGDQLVLEHFMLENPAVPCGCNIEKAKVQLPSRVGCGTNLNFSIWAFAWLQRAPLKNFPWANILAQHFTAHPISVTHGNLGELRISVGPTAQNLQKRYI